ncbi:MAG: hypothetical protein RRY65_03810 [Pseudoflavonifractor sp.]
MKRRTVLTLIFLSVATLIALSGASWAWFITLNETPVGQINSALVQYYPDQSQRSVPELLTYGTLISGDSVDKDGKPLTLPGDRLLASVATAPNGNHAIRTSVARPFETGETVGTVVNGEICYVKGKALTKTQRDLFTPPKTTINWYKGTEPAPVTPPAIDPALYQVATTSKTQVTTPAGQTVTTTTVIVSYTPIDPKNPAYRREEVTITLVTHEAAKIPAGWPNPATPQLTYTETVLAITGQAGEANRVTRSRLQILDERIITGDGTYPKTTNPLPLVLENRSNVETNVRLGVSVILTPNGGNGETLTMREAAGKFYFGKSDAKNNFIELLELTPGAEAGKYGWIPVTEETAAPLDAWHLWDLNLTTGGKIIPPIPTPAPTPTPTLPPPSTAPTAAPSPAPVYYRAVQELALCTGSHFNVEQATFENNFNNFYCVHTPTITVMVRYYAKQGQYMEWQEFYSQKINMSVYGN